MLRKTKARKPNPQNAINITNLFPITMKNDAKMKNKLE